MVLSCNASRILWSMNHAVFCVTPNALPSSQELIPFFALTIIQNAGSHLSIPRGDSSNIVPTFTLNCFLQPRHLNRFCFARYSTFSEPHFAQAGFPLGQRIDTMNACAFSRTAKY